MNRLTTKSVFQPSLLLAAAMGAGLLAIAGTSDAADARGVERTREVQQERREERASLPTPRGEAPRPPQPRMAPPAAQQPRMAPPPPRVQGGGPGAPPQLRPYRGGGDNDTRTYDRSGRPVVVGPPRGSAGPNARIVPPSRAYVTRAPRYVPSLPPGHRRYDWRGSAYYFAGGNWYRPYQNRFVIVGPPVGLFVSYLPGSYSTMWVGGTRYYYADDVYYTYEPTRRGYVVARSPYDDDRDDYDLEDDEGGRDQDLYIYPMRGQSEQQQSDDRYECHRWAVKETHYDPTDSSYDRNDRSDYDRAISACLTGRGYSVK